MENRCIQGINRLKKKCIILLVLILVSLYSFNALKANIRIFIYTFKV